MSEYANITAALRSRAGAARDGSMSETAKLCTAAADMLDERKGELKNAFVAGCCAVLTWTHSGMPQDDLDEAGYDYAASVMK